jgi:two-component system chemotaxis response regulator CheY
MAHHILIVDDSVLMRTALKRTIDMVGIETESISEAGNGLEALAVLESKPIDLILTDLNMPEMNGVELVHCLKEKPEYANIPIIVITTESNVLRIEDLQAEGIQDYLHKPFTPEEFRETILRSLGVCK